MSTKTNNKTKTRQLPTITQPLQLSNIYSKVMQS